MLGNLAGDNSTRYQCTKYAVGRGRVKTLTFYDADNAGNVAESPATVEGAKIRPENVVAMSGGAKGEQRVEAVAFTDKRVPAAQ